MKTLGNIFTYSVVSFLSFFVLTFALLLIQIVIVIIPAFIMAIPATIYFCLWLRKKEKQK